MATDDNAAARPSPTGPTTCAKPVSRTGFLHVSEIVPTTRSTARFLPLPDLQGSSLMLCRSRNEDRPFPQGRETSTSRAQPLIGDCPAPLQWINVLRAGGVLLGGDFRSLTANRE